MLKDHCQSGMHKLQRYNKNKTLTVAAKYILVPLAVLKTS